MNAQIYDDAQNFTFSSTETWVSVWVRWGKKPHVMHGPGPAGADWLLWKSRCSICSCGSCTATHFPAVLEISEWQRGRCLAEIQQWKLMETSKSDCVKVLLILRHTEDLWNNTPMWLMWFRDRLISFIYRWFSTDGCWIGSSFCRTIWC